MSDLYFPLVRIIGIYQVLVIVYVIAGWLNAFGAIPYNRALMGVLGVLERLCEPPLRWLRGFLPTLGGLDFSPIVVLIGLEFLKAALRQLFFG
ncbi:MAG TPA: YggT family protein [Sphingomonadales bacterium]|nr:YggT family protein [Sphingomonadales bacterium]